MLTETGPSIILVLFTSVKNVFLTLSTQFAGSYIMKTSPGGSIKDRLQPEGNSGHVPAL